MDCVEVHLLPHDHNPARPFPVAEESIHGGNCFVLICDTSPDCFPDVLQPLDLLKKPDWKDRYIKTKTGVSPSRSPTHTSMAFSISSPWIPTATLISMCWGRSATEERMKNNYSTYPQNHLPFLSYDRESFSPWFMLSKTLPVKKKLYRLYGLPFRWPDDFYMWTSNWWA